MLTCNLNFAMMFAPQYFSSLCSFFLFCLLAALVDLVEELLEHSLLETLALINVIDEGLDLVAALLLKRLVVLLQLQVVVELLDNLLLVVVLLAVVVLKDLALLGGGDGEGLVDEP